MPKGVPFEKYVAAGNDFVVVDNRRGQVSGNLKSRSIQWCDRKMGLGADGVLYLEKSKKADVRMRIFNPDGSEADMCGNGVRCLARFALERGAAAQKMSIETGAGLIHADVKGQVV